MKLGGRRPVWGEQRTVTRFAWLPKKESTGQWFVWEWYWSKEIFTSFGWGPTEISRIRA